MRNEQITLVTKYKAGTDVKEYTYTVWAERKSVARTEFYAAYAAGLHPQLVFDILPEEYALADVVVNDKKYKATRIRTEDNEEYEITRTYSKNRSSMELTVG